MEKRLFRNEYDKVVAGVSSGVAEYMEVDVTIIRLLFVLSTIFLVGTGVLVYLILWIVVPVNNDPAVRFSKFNDFFNKQNNPFNTTNPFTKNNPSEGTGPFQDWTSSTMKEDSHMAWKKSGDFKAYKKDNETGRTVAGLFLLVIGLYFLMDEFNLIPFGFKLAKLWPVVFIAIGISFIIKSKNKKKWEAWKNENPAPGTAAPETPASPGFPVDPVAPANPENQNFGTADPASIDFTKKDQ
ncbi:PspC domain-containing protein [Pedobacter sp. MC2016-24]|uniref:PspC domain-containing protein n=1 Tax=Pedobacter sp. MC2016-24 TaxID=2780090 RepID=UPI0018829972|nr:PspC domain-containing protein [Pedobacter sp. MC2016-24]MBE9602424.1 PspC domain-containing protein [Pedobacter sp. MC2016-24]